MSELPISLRYRISGHRGLLYVRELVLGEIIARIPSAKSTLVASDASGVAAECASVLLGPIDSITHDVDVVYVTCRIEASRGHGIVGQFGRSKDADS